MFPSQHISAEQLHRFFRPRSIALVGATDNSRWSLYTFENLKTLSFVGPIYLVNPRREVVHGTHAYPSLQDLPAPVDLAFIMVPTPGVLPVVREAAALGTRHFVVLTSGFSEMGAQGAELERELLTFAQEHALTILGPNGNGFINVTDQITPYGLPIATPLKSGPVGVVLQSGALASAVLAFAQGHAIGLSLLVAMGNESMISVTDVVDYLLEDEETRSIALFLESIRHPAELSRVAEKARARRKAIVALKIGRSEASSRTAFAHTGALKIQSAALPHKSDIGGVTLDLRSEEAVHAEFTAMLERVQALAPDAEIEGILVSPLRPAGMELLVGVVRDPLWGLVLTVGLGGIWTEVLKDTAIRVLPVRRAEIETMLGELRGAELLLGARGQRQVDLQALIAVIERIGVLALALGPRLSVLEINPLLIDATRIEALDVLVGWQD